MIPDSEGRAPLHWAVDRGHLNITKLLLSRNADVNAKVHIVFNTAKVHIILHHYAEPLILFQFCDLLYICFVGLVFFYMICFI